MTSAITIAAVIIALAKVVIWQTKLRRGMKYRPITHNQKSRHFVSIVAPVLNEDPKKLLKAINAWTANKPKEIIIVIDFTDITSINLVKKVQKNNALVHLIVTKEAGKRSALVKGFKHSSGDIVVFVDSDTIWSKTTLQKLLLPFASSNIGAVNCRNRVSRPITFAQKYFSLQINKYYLIDYPYLCASGKRSLLSGRTTAYRRAALSPIIDTLTHEMFLGAPSVAGDDSYLARKLQDAGWHFWYQKNAVVTTFGTPKMMTFLEQMLRWYRDAARYAIGTIETNRLHNQSILFWIDKNIEIAGFLEGICLLTLLATQQWVVFLEIFALFVTLYAQKYHKIFPTNKNPFEFIRFYLFEIVVSFTQLYAIMTPAVQGWLTRGRGMRTNANLALSKS